MQSSNNDIRLRWVLADPATERGVDPLGLGAQADKIADFLLPQLSVATTRARYFSFLCWAVQQRAATSVSIHRLEAQLAIEEARSHPDEESRNECPGVIGRGRALRHFEENNGKPPTRPETLYKNTAFSIYRPAMRALGLLSNRRAPRLTRDGERLANAFKCSRGRAPRCLCDISASERTQIAVLLGLDGRQNSDRLSSAARRRRATCDVVARLLENTTDAANVLEKFATKPRRTNAVTEALHRAFVWELLSTGLALAFSMLLDVRNVTVVGERFRAALRKRLRRPPLGSLSPRDKAAADDVVALLRAAVKFRPRELNLDPLPFLLAERLVVARKPREFIECLVKQHCRTKADAPWIQISGGKIRVLVPQKSSAFDVRPRNYRLDAFRQLLRDLGRIR